MTDTPEKKSETENETGNETEIDNEFDNEFGSATGNETETESAFDPELENLDDFMKAEEDRSITDDDPFLMDEEELIPVMEEKNGGRGMKIAGYIALVAVLGGVGYAGAKYLPQLMGDSEPDVFQQDMADSTDSFGQSAEMFDTATPQQSQAIAEGESIMPEPPEPPATVTPAPEIVDLSVFEPQPSMVEEPVSPMPMAADSEAASQENDLSISGVDVTVVREGEEMPADIAAMMEEPTASQDQAAPPQAGTISEALEITQTAPAPETATIPDSEFDVADDTPESAPAEGTSEQAAIVTETDEMPAAPVADVEMESGFNRIPAGPMANDMEDDLPPVSEEKIATADRIMSGEMPAESEPVAEENPAEPVAEIELIETAPVMEVPVETQTAEAESEPEPELMTEDVVETEAEPEPELEPEPEVIEVEVETAAPRPAPVAQPKPAVIESKPAINAAAQLGTATDPRIYEGRKALNVGDFDRATQIFDAILRDNPSNVHALTGKQMALARIRYTGSDIAAPQAAAPMAATPDMRPTEMFVPRRSYDPATSANPPRLQPSIQPLQAAPQPGLPPQAQSAPQIQAQPVVPVIATPQPTTTEIGSPQPVAPTAPTTATVTAPISGGGDIQTLLAQARANPNDAALAMRIGDAYRAAGDAANAVTWYRKALQIDAVFRSGIDRMAVYDRLADMQ